MSETIHNINFDVSNENNIYLRRIIKKFLKNNQIRYYNFKIIDVRKKISELKE